MSLRRPPIYPKVPKLQIKKGICFGAVRCLAAAIEDPVEKGLNSTPDRSEVNLIARAMN